MSIILIIGVHIDRLANAHRAIRQCSHLGPPAEIIAESILGGLHHVYKHAT